MAKVFLEVKFFTEKNLNFEINPKILRRTSERKPCRKFHGAVTTLRQLKAGTMELDCSQKVPSAQYRKVQVFREYLEFINKFKSVARHKREEIV